MRSMNLIDSRVHSKCSKYQAQVFKFNLLYRLSIIPVDFPGADQLGRPSIYVGAAGWASESSRLRFLETRNM